MMSQPWGTLITLTTPLSSRAYAIVIPSLRHCHPERSEGSAFCFVERHTITFRRQKSTEAVHKE